MRPIDADHFYKETESWRNDIVEELGENDEFATCLINVLMHINEEPTVKAPVCFLCGEPLIIQNTFELATITDEVEDIGVFVYSYCCGKCGAEYQMQHRDA